MRLCLFSQQVGMHDDAAASSCFFASVANLNSATQPVLPAAAGNNVGDCCRISLPRWVLEAGEADPDIFFTDSSGYRNRECLSVGCDDQPVLAGRTPVQAQVCGDARLDGCCCWLVFEGQGAAFLRMCANLIQQQCGLLVGELMHCLTLDPTRSPYNRTPG